MPVSGQSKDAIEIPKGVTVKIEGTRITVNCRYVVTVEVTGAFVAEDAFGSPVQQGALPSSTSTASFSTNAPVRANWGTPTEPSWVAFRSTGKFENDILSILRNPLP